MRKFKKKMRQRTKVTPGNRLANTTRRRRRKKPFQVVDETMVDLIIMNITENAGEDDRRPNPREDRNGEDEALRI